MRIVIDISEEEYKLCKRQYDTECLDTLMIAVKYGTPLPKGLGRLIDADALLKKHPNIDTYPFPSTTIDNAPTIIEAESEGK